METFIDYFKIILTGDKESSRQAARQVRKFLYSSKGSDKFEDISFIIDNAATEYKKISDDWRQENFVMAVSVIYYLHNRENQPDFLFPWLFHLLQCKNGNIRHAAVRMIGNELGPLTYHLRFPNKSHLGKLTPERVNFILFQLFINLDNLASALWKPVYKRYKYISSLPNGPYKSVQIVLGHMEDDCGLEYMEYLIKTGPATI